MSQFIPFNIIQENSLSLVIHLTLTNSTISRQARIEALQRLVDACSRAIESCLDASDATLANIDEEDKYRAKLNDIRTDLPADVRRTLAQVTDTVRRRSREEFEAIGRNVRTLRGCKREAEQGRECGISLSPLLSDLTLREGFGWLI